MKNDKYLYWLLGVGCGVILAGSFMTYVGLTVQNEIITLEQNTEKVIIGQSDQVRVEGDLQGLKEDETLINDQDVESETTRTNTEETPEEPIEDRIDYFIEEENEDESKEQVETIKVAIPSDATATAICQILQEAGVIESATDFRKYIEEQNKSTKLRTGEMSFEVNGAFSQVLSTLLGQK